MDQNEIMSLLRKIKANWGTFRINDPDVVTEFSKVLIHYNANEVNDNLADYMENNREEPKVCDLIYGLKKIKNEVNTVAIYTCPHCQKRYRTYEAMVDCFEKDRTMAYISKLSDLLGINPNDYFPPYFFRSSTADLNRNYDRWIARVIEEQKREPRLAERELRGLREYYKHVVLNK